MFKPSQYLSSSFLFFQIYRQIVSKWKKIPLLDRWILQELFPSFCFAVSALTLVALSVGVMFELVRKIVESGLSLGFALQAFILKLPSFLVISFPMAILMATLLTYSRLSSNSEIKALKSLGISTKRIVIPALALGVLMTGITFIFNDLIVPSANQYAKETLQKGLRVSMNSNYVKDIMYTRKGKIIDPDSKYNSGPGFGAAGGEVTHLFYAKELQNKQMIDITVLDFSRLGYKQMLTAKKAYWNDLDADWEFENGELLTISPKGGTTFIRFDNYIYPLDSAPQEIAQMPDDAKYMSLSDAYKAKEFYKSSGNKKDTLRMKLRIQEKYALPMSCIVFSLIGSSIACRDNLRASQGMGFSLSIILILFYYLLSFIFSSLSISGALSPFLGAWVPVLVSLSGGVYLLNNADD